MENTENSRRRVIEIAGKLDTNVRISIIDEFEKAPVPVHTRSFMIDLDKARGSDGVIFFPTRAQLEEFSRIISDWLEESR